LFPPFQSPNEWLFLFEKASKFWVSVGTVALSSDSFPFFGAFLGVDNDTV
jgi:hypothetical protein